MRGHGCMAFGLAAVSQHSDEEHAASEPASRSFGCQPHAATPCCHAGCRWHNRCGARGSQRMMRARWPIMPGLCSVGWRLVSMKSPSTIVRYTICGTTTTERGWTEQPCEQGGQVGRAVRMGLAWASTLKRHAQRGECIQHPAYMCTSQKPHAAVQPAASHPAAAILRRCAGAARLVRRAWGAAAGAASQQLLRHRLAALRRQ